MGVSSVQPRHWGTVAEGWDGDGGPSYREVLDILVLRIDDLGELLAVNLLLEHPHAHLLLEALRGRAPGEDVLAGDLRRRRAPVPAADNAHLCLF